MRGALRTTGRRAVRSAVGRARSRLTGRRLPALGWAPASLRPRYDVVVVGGGLAGTWLAFELAQRTDAPVALLDPASIGTGWPSRARVVPHGLRSHPQLVDLARRSAERYETLAVDEGFRHRVGRLDVVAVVGSQPDPWGSTVVPALGAALGAGVELVAMVDAARLVPHLDPSCADGALVETAAPAVEADVLPWELAARAAAGGVAVVEGCAVLDAVRADGGWTLDTTCGPTSAPLVIDASPGADVMVAAGLDHHCLWHRWERLYTDPVQPFLRAELEVDGVGIGQTDRGEVVLRGPARPAPPATGRPSVSAAAAAADTALGAVPALAKLRMVMQTWSVDLLAGDGLPVVGRVVAPGGPDGLHRLGGFGPAEPALAPAAAAALADALSGAPGDVALVACRSDRFDVADRPAPAASAGTMG